MSEILGTEHPNESEVVFRISANIPPELCNIYADAAAAQENGLARALFLIMGVTKVQIATNHITLTRDPAVIWPLVIPPAINIISSRIKKIRLEVA